MPGWRSTERATAAPRTADLRIEPDGGRTALVFSGRLNAAGAGGLWSTAMRAATAARGQALRFDLTAVEAFDMAGAALLLAAERAHGKPTEVTGANPHATDLLARARRAVPGVAAVPAAQGGAEGQAQGQPPGQIQGQTQGQQTQGQAHGRTPWRDQWQAIFPVAAATLEVLANGVAFIGEVMVAVLRLPARRRMLPLSDLLRYADQAGVRALPLVMLLGFLMGTILAFQSVVPMRPYGADLFVANLVTVSLLRELGALLSAVILAGRTGSAFAAEIGTMKVNQELDALVTMGLDPMTMLVLPRLIAVMLVLPALALVLDITGLLGMTAVMHGFGFPVVTIMHQVQGAATISDLLGGLFKAVCFGAAIAAIGCRAGLSTGHGPRAVGLSATAAVVGAIISTIVLDGALAVMFYRLNL
ncbi:MAG TPA: ABC transporter permease [Acetobacteraceae bacterium]|nr:ABC transporter permease [Acetobacteraceae bacterium]